MAYAVDDTPAATSPVGALRRVPAIDRDSTGAGPAWDALASAVQRLATTLGHIAAQLDGLSNQVITLEDWDVDERIVRNGRSLLGRVVKKATRVSTEDLDELDAAVADGRLTPAEIDDLALADSLFRGTAAVSRQEIVVVVEASKTIDVHDIERAEVRALILRRAGYNAVALVGGSSIRPEDEDRARDRGVAIMLGGLVRHWPAAAA